MKTKTMHGLNIYRILCILVTALINTLLIISFAMFLINEFPPINPITIGTLMMVFAIITIYTTGTIKLIITLAGEIKETRKMLQPRQKTVYVWENGKYVERIAYPLNKIGFERRD